MRGTSICAVLIVVIMATSGCIYLYSETVPSVEEGSVQELVVSVCVQACREALDAGQDLDAGPCLLDPIPENPKWVCDVAHDPRQPVDNLRENQCDAWHAGTAEHFVEVTPTCDFIRAY